ncbi:MAG: rhomboid family intramembrane serine protease [Pseudomonadota bacterium]
MPSPIPSSNDPSPVNSVPAPVLALAAFVFGIEVLFWLGSRGVLGGDAGIALRVTAFEDYGFAPRLWAFMVQNGAWSFDGLQRFVTYAFVNVSFLSTTLSCVFILAFGKFVGEVMGGARALVIFVVATVGAALVYGSVFPDQSLLYGAFPGAYGLLGAYTYILFLILDGADENRMQAFRLVGILAGLQLVFGILFGGPPHWAADIAGAAIGFLTAAALGPGGIARLLRR